MRPIARASLALLASTTLFVSVARAQVLTLDPPSGSLAGIPASGGARLVARTVAVLGWTTWPLGAACSSTRDCSRVNG